jgi:hypothetical protein
LLPTRRSSGVEPSICATHQLCRSAWWLPRGLDRILPDVDIEGTPLDATPFTRTTDK